MQAIRPIFLSACLGMLLFGVSLVTLGSVAPGLREKFSLDSISFGTLFSILPFGILTGSLLFGPLADRYGYKAIFILSGLTMFAGFQGIAYASSVSLLSICVFLFGLGGGAINGSSNAVVSDISDKNKGANLSLLGVFFAVGALGMPFILGILEKKFSFEAIVASVGYSAMLGTILFASTRFPVAKQASGVSISDIGKLLSDTLLLFVGFFLVCQSSFEAIINNWTTTFLVDKIPIETSEALYALSLYVAGMAVMRVILGRILRVIPSGTILLMSIALLVIGGLTLKFATSFVLSAIGLVVLGAGLAAGYPVTLSYVGDRYAAVSGTAFSIVISMALMGSMVVNYVMGQVAQRYGVQHLTTMVFVLTAGMLAFSLIILKKLKS
jgi:FHS family glucose/mannose:H+ symporter-like MFS transporter